MLLTLGVGKSAAAQDPTPREPEVATETDDPLQATPGQIVGKVVDEKGEPLEGVLVDAWTWWQGTETKTDAEGRFLLNPKADDRERAEIRFSKPGYSPHYIVQQAVGAEPLRIVLDRQTYLEGILTDAAGLPVPNATIRGEQGPQQGDGVMITSVATETQTDADGRYRLYLYPDTYEIKVSVPGRGVARLSGITVNSDQAKTLDIQLAEGVRFVANVVDAHTGDPVEGFVLWSWRQPEVFGKSGPDGTLVIDPVLPGKFEFQTGGGEPIKRGGIEGYQHGPFGRWWSSAGAREWDRKQLEPDKFQRNLDGLEFDLSTGMEPITIEVERGVTFFGTVSDPEGNPVAGATVAPAKTGSGNSLTGDTRYSAETDANGNYRVVMPAGNDFQYNLIAHDGKFREWRRWANAVTEPMQSRPGDEIEVNITLNRPSTVRGKVVADGDRIVAGLKVRSHAADLRGNRYYDPTVETDADGKFEFKAIRPGKHYIQVEPFFLTASQAPTASTAIVQLSEGETVEGIELRATANNIAAAPAMVERTFVVQVVDAEDHPVAGVSVLASMQPSTSAGALFGDSAGLADRMKSTKEDPSRQVTGDDGRVTIDGKHLFGSRPAAATMIAIDVEGKRAAVGLLYPDAKSDTSTLRLLPMCDTRIELNTEKLVEHAGMPQSAGIVYLLKGGSLVAMQQSVSPSISVQLPPGEYELMLQFANSKLGRHALTIPNETSYQAAPIALEPSRLSLLFGKPAPPLREIADWHGSDPGTLESLRGRVVLLEFWGYWCGPCIASMPELMTLHDEYSQRGVTIIGIHDASISDSQQLAEKINAFRGGVWNGRDLPFPSAIAGGGVVKIEGTELSANGRVIADYGISEFPTTLLIDKQGNIAGQVNLRDPAAAKKQIEALLKTPDPSVQ